MKRIPVILALVAIALVAYSMSNFPMSSSDQLVASSNTTTETRQVGEFERIEVEGIFAIDVTYSSTEEVEVEAPENLQEYIELTVKSGTLHVKVSKKININSSCSLKVHVKTAKLNGFKLSGASSAQLNNTLKDNNLSIRSTGAASFSGDVDVKEAEINLDGAASVNLSGNAQSTKLNLSGASQLNDYRFKVDHLKVELSGASSTTITALKHIEGNVTGASTLNYGGGASDERVSVSGASKLNKR